MKNFIFYTILFLLSVPIYTHGATVFFDTPKKILGTGEEFLVEVFLNTEKAIVNGVEGKIQFPEEVFSVKEIRMGDSSINFWVEQPEFQKDTLSFSGITPGGLSGDKKFLFSFVLKTKVPGQEIVSTKDMKVFLHDGEGTEVPVKDASLVFSIDTKISTNQISAEVDTEIPEDFTPFIVENEETFGAERVLVFYTQDKLSGIDYYEVREGFFSSFKKAESPYVLKNKIDKTVYVKAVDKSGNERVVKISQFTKEIYWYIFAILFIIVLLLLLKRKFYAK